MTLTYVLVVLVLVVLTASFMIFRRRRWGEGDLLAVARAAGVAREERS